MTDRLNPEALEAARLALGRYNSRGGWLNEQAEVTIRAYLAALPGPRTIEGVYDLGSQEPEGVDHVIECDEHGNPHERDPECSNDPTWSKTIDGTRWKGYKDGKEYRDWGDLVRRYGPVIDVRWVPAEGGGDAT